MSEYIITCDEETALWVGNDVDAMRSLVRCRDCKHAFKADLSGNWYECMKPDGNGDYARLDVEPDGFCKWSERRTDE